ncbi:hypothetical protein [Phreatobacter sp.]|uniref:hypothetical protein n=1 Tax=Phreatobacter sp. TaxID=1966341 RepID=UPI003F72000F
MIRPALACILLVTLAMPAPADDQPPADRVFRFTPAQTAAVERLEARLRDGDLSRQVYSPAFATRACYEAALQQSASREAARDQNGLTAAQRVFFAGCVEHSGYLLGR